MTVKGDFYFYIVNYNYCVCLTLETLCNETSWWFKRNKIFKMINFECELKTQSANLDLYYIQCMDKPSLVLLNEMESPHGNLFWYKVLKSMFSWHQQFIAENTVNLWTGNHFLNNIYRSIKIHGHKVFFSHWVSC